jgi:hypothetical protein
MAKPDADYSGMTDFESVKTKRTEVDFKGGVYPTGHGGIAGDNNLGGFESVEADVSVTKVADELFEESFGPRVIMDEEIVPDLPGGQVIKPFYSGEGSGHVSQKPPGFDDWHK